jgi:flagellar protein FlaJ
MKMPVVPFGFENAKKASSFLSYWARLYSRSFPRLQVHLSQAGADVEPVEYISVTMFSAGFYAVISFFMVLLLGQFSPAAFQTVVLVALMSALTAYVFVFMYVINFPRLLIERKLRSVNRDLPYALRHLLVQVSSGVSLYDSAASIADGDYGEISREFGKIITETQGGMDFITALEDSAMKNPYPNYRNAVWQLSNASKAGSDISSVIRDIVSNVTEDQKTEIKSYGSNLQFLSLMYMVLTIAVPTIGVVFLMMVSTFLGAALPPPIFIGVLFFLVMVQYMFVGIIQARRPAVVV